MQFSEEQIREAFFKMFNESEEWFFVNSSDRLYNKNITEATWLEFLDTLLEVADESGYSRE